MVTGEDAIQLAEQPGIKRYPNCPGRAYMQALIRDFAGTLPAQAQEFSAELQSNAELTLEASTSIASHIVGVDGMPHAFLANFKGLIGGKNPIQTPEVGAQLMVNQRATAQFLPFLGGVQTLRGEYREGKTTVVLPEIERAPVVWLRGP